MDNIVNVNNIIDKKNIRLEYNGSKNNMWINGYTFYKEDTTGSLESYSEVFNYYLMNKLGLFKAYNYL